MFLWLMLLFVFISLEVTNHNDDIYLLAVNLEWMDAKKKEKKIRVFDTMPGRPQKCRTQDE